MEDGGADHVGCHRRVATSLEWIPAEWICWSTSTPPASDQRAKNTRPAKRARPGDLGLGIPGIYDRPVDHIPFFPKILCWLLRRRAPGVLLPCRSLPVLLILLIPGVLWTTALSLHSAYSLLHRT